MLAVRCATIREESGTGANADLPQRVQTGLDIWWEGTDWAERTALSEAQNLTPAIIMSLQTDAAAELKKKRTFKKFYYRGVDLDQLLDMKYKDLMTLYNSRMRRRFNRGLKRKHMALIRRLNQTKKVCFVCATLACARCCSYSTAGQTLSVTAGVTCVDTGAAHTRTATVRAVHVSWSTCKGESTALIGRGRAGKRQSSGRRRTGYSSFGRDGWETGGERCPALIGSCCASWWGREWGSA